MQSDETLSLPYRADPINERTLRVMDRILEFNEDQRAIVRQLYSEYRAKHSNYLFYGDGPVDPERKRPMIQGGPAPFEKGFAAYLEEHSEEYVRIRRTLQSFSDTFFADVASILSEPDEIGMQRARWAHERFLLQRGDSDLPAGRVDLVQMVLDLPISDETRAALEPWFLDFEPRFIEALRDLDLANKRYWIGYNRDAVPLMEQQRTLPADAYEEREQIYNRFLQQAETHVHTYFAAKKRLHDLVLDGKRSVSELLSREEAAELERRFNEIAFDLIYPDHTSAEPLYEAALAIENLQDEQRTAINVHRQLYREQHADVSERMEHARLIHRMANGLRWDRMDAAKGESWRKLREAGYEREYLNEDQLDVLRSILTPQQFEQLPEWDFDKNPPRRPWDPTSDRHPRRGYERNKK